MPYYLLGSGVIFFMEYRHASFYCASQILCFSQMERLWQPRTEQISLLHFSNSSCLRGESGSHFGHSRDISDFCIMIVFVMVSAISEL